MKRMSVTKARGIRKNIGIMLALMFIAACGTTSMYFTVTRPAEINLKGIEKIALGEFTGSRYKDRASAKDIKDEISTALFTSQRFDVLERDQLNAIIKEQKLGHSGMVNEDSATELGQFVGASAFVFGRVQKNSYNESTRRGSTYFNKKEGKSYTTYYRDGKHTLRVNVKVIDGTTAKVIAMKNIDVVAKTTKSATNKVAPSIDRDALYAKTVKDVAKKFMKMIAPYQEQVRASFQTDKNLPEIEQALVYFKTGEWNDGLQLLESAKNKAGLETKVKAKAFYNLGLAQTYASEHESAIENIKMAMKLVPASSVYQKALLKAKKEKADAEKLKEQI